MYLGEFECKIDNKNRLFVPATFRKNLNEIVLTYIDEDTLVVKEKENWTPSSVLKGASIPTSKLKKLSHYIEHNSIVLKIDSQGRIVIPSEIMKKLSFTNISIILGRTDTFLIMNKDKYISECEKLNKEWNTFLESEEGQNYKMSLIFRKK